MRIYPVFLSHAGCRQRCVFCNQRAAERIKPWKESIEETFHYIQKSNLVYDEIAFYGGTPTSSENLLKDILQPFQTFLKIGKIKGIRISTRPDEINESIIQILVDYGVSTVEIGVESFSDEVLRLSKRGHTEEDVKRAHELLKGRFREVFQLMVGLPGETDRHREETISKTVSLKPWGVRYFPTLVLRGTELQKMYESGAYQPLSMEEALYWSRRAYESFMAAGIAVLQIGLHSSEFLSEELVAGPYCGNFGELVRGVM